MLFDQRPRICFFGCELLIGEDAFVVELDHFFDLVEIAHLTRSHRRARRGISTTLLLVLGSHLLVLDAKLIHRLNEVVILQLLRWDPRVLFNTVGVTSRHLVGTKCDQTPHQQNATSPNTATSPPVSSTTSRCSSTSAATSSRHVRPFRLGHNLSI